MNNKDDIFYRIREEKNKVPSIVFQDCFPRLHNPSLEEFQKISRDGPCVISGVVTEWEGFRKWTPGYLKETYRDLHIRVRDKRDGLYTSRKDVLANPGKEITFSEYVEKIIESNSPSSENYYMFERDPRDFPGLELDFITPYYLNGKQSYKGFWVSGKGASTPLHYDRGHNFLAQVKGQKRLIIYKPNLSYFYPYSRSGVSQVNLENPDYDKFPNFKFAQKLVCILKEGEMLYLPSCWWHQVYSEASFNVSINFFWKPSVRYMLSTPGPSFRPYWIKFYENIEKFLKDHCIN